MSPTVFEEKRKTLLGYKKLREKNTTRHLLGGRIRRFFDDGSFEEMYADVETIDPLAFPGYRETLDKNRRKTETKDACIVARGTADGIPLIGAQLSRNFMMGSMGTVAGEKLARAFEEADRCHLPIVVFSASGGARMQEGMLSLMQMAKTSAAVQRLRDHGGLYISVLTNPTTGGVSASYASLGDIILAEPGALIGFAGPRVIEQTIREKLPEGFQRAEFQLEHGFVDKVVPQNEMKATIVQLLKLHGYQATTEESGQAEDFKASEDRGQENSFKIEEGGSDDPAGYRDPASIIAECAAVRLAKEPRKPLTGYDRLTIARAKDRPKITDYIDQLFDGFVELCGDRLGREDPAILGGIAFFEGRPVTVIGHRKGAGLGENLKYNFGMPEPQGYRKALRLMKDAEKYGRPVITFIDTPGAYPGKEAEENGQSVAIAENLAAMSTLKVPTLAIVTGEGNSGGALAISVSDRIWMLENAVYSVLSPEGFASILWKDASRSKEACDVCKMTARDLQEAGIADLVIPEPKGGIQKDLTGTCRLIRDLMRNELQELCRTAGQSEEALLTARYEKYRRIGQVLEQNEETRC